jgi:4'-phosphopantetheinyl transferase
MKNKLKSIQSSIDVWNILLPDVFGELDACTEILTIPEQKRAKRFIKKKDAQQFILCRGLRRKILADYLDQAPQRLHFSQNKNGKPFLEDCELNFNVSHSRNRLLIAVTSGRAVGVDIEFRRDDVQMDAIAQRWFAPEEQAFFQGLENPQIGFFDIWAKKEAYVKARGQGIFHKLNSFSVPLDTTSDVPTIGQKMKLARNDSREAEKSGEWFFQTLEIDPAYAAAIVSEAPPVPVQFQKFTTHE